MYCIAALKLTVLYLRGSKLGYFNCEASEKDKFNWKRRSSYGSYNAKSTHRNRFCDSVKYYESSPKLFTIVYIKLKITAIDVQYAS